MAGELESPTLSQVISLALDTRQRYLHTALPARVERYDAAAQVVDAKPMIKRALYTNKGDKRLEALPVVPAVPVAFPQAGGFMVTVPIKEGDHVLLVFSERDIGEWRRTGEDSDPGDQRFHPLHGAFAIPGVVPEGSELASASGENMVVGEDGGNRMEIEPGGPMHLGQQSAGEQDVALAGKVESELQAIREALKSVAGGSDTGGSDLTGSNPYTSVGDVGSSSVKAD